MSDSDVRIYRNDGELIHGSDGEAATLPDEVNPGVTLLYADTRAQRLCGYFEATLGYPCQATASIRYDAAETATAELDGHIRNYVERQNGTLPAAEDIDTVDHHSVFAGLAADDVPRIPGDWLGRIREAYERALWKFGPDEAVRSGRNLVAALVSRVRTGQRDDFGTPQLDFGVPTPWMAAGVFRSLLDTLDGLEVTIAASTAGRTDRLAETDVVIDVNPEYDGLCMFEETESLLRDTGGLPPAVEESVDELERWCSAIDRDATEIVQLAERLDDALDTGHGPSYQLVRTRTRRLMQAMLLAVGIVGGIVLGIALRSSLLDWYGRVSRFVASTLAVGPAMLASSSGRFALLCLFSALAAGALWRRQRHLRRQEAPLGATTIDQYLLRLGTNAMIVLLAGVSIVAGLLAWI